MRTKHTSMNDRQSVIARLRACWSFFRWYHDTTKFPTMYLAARIVPLTHSLCAYKFAIHFSVVVAYIFLACVKQLHNYIEIAAYILLATQPNPT